MGSKKKIIEAQTSDDQNTITIVDDIYEAIIKDDAFCNGCELGAVLFTCWGVPCKSNNRKDRQCVIFKKKSDNNN